MQSTISTSRLVLRPYTEADAPDVQRLVSDARIADTTAVIPHPYPEGAALAWIATHAAAHEAGRASVFAVTRRDDGLLLGTVTLLDTASPDRRSELGYWIGVEYWGQGFCTEAVRGLIDFAHAELGISRIVARCFARNIASARVMEKAGLRREGLLQRDVLKNGRYEDVLLYGLVLPGREDI